LKIIQLLLLLRYERNYERKYQIVLIP